MRVFFISFFRLDFLSILFTFFFLFLGGGGCYYVMVPLLEICLGEEIRELVMIFSAQGSEEKTLK